MKLNQPVTDREVLMKENTILVTKTDINGKITFANDHFIEISGFRADELIGSDHNIVRHPDMPAEAFADLWATIKQGNPWRQLVKNRTKSGDYYWIEANVTPIYNNNNLDGFLSVTYSPSREQIRDAEQLYEQLRNHKVTLRPSGYLEKINFIKRLSVTNKLIISSILFLVPAFLATHLFVKEKNMVIEFAQQEVIGIEYHTAFTELLIHIGEYSGVSSLNIKTDTSAVEQARHVVESDIAALDNLDSKYGEVLKTTEAWHTIKQNWVSLSTENLSLLPAEELYNKQSKFIESLYTFISDLNDNSNLMLDPDLDSFWLMDMSNVKLPDLVERLVFLRGYLAINYNGEQFTNKQKIDLVLRYRLALRLFDKVTESATKATRYNDTVASALTVKRANLDAVIKQYLTEVRANLIDGDSTAISSDQYYSAGTKAIQAAESFYTIGENNLKQLIENRIHKVEQEKWTLLAIVFTLLFVALAIAFFVIRHINKSVTKVNDVFTRLANNRYKNRINLDETDEFGEMLRGLQNMQIKLFSELSEARNQVQKNLLIKQALDNAQSCVMVANPNQEIIYMNNSVLAMFENAQSDIRTELPNFDANKLLGANIDQFHKNPAHQRGLLGNLSSTFSWQLFIGGRSMTIVANPVINNDGERIGIVVEWLDRTHEVKIEQEIEAIVEAVKAGELSNRISLDDKNGFFQKLSEGINALSDVIERVFSEIGNTMQAMAEGDLTLRIDSDYQGDYLNCKNDINATLDKLSDIFGKVSESANFINNSSQEIASGNNNLSQRAEQQAANLQETAASMEELTGTVKNNANNAQQANLVANNARELAENGGNVVKAAVLAMQEINQSSNKIADIIGVIDEIAFQTNLLALNASVEAARAGEQGRGFSVVATEVRNLAQRSATAAKESKELIQNSVQKVRTGTEFVNETGKALTEIVAGVKKVGDIVAEIAAASIEQSAGIGQVNQAVSQMDEITQQNAALAEQASAASVSMSDLSSNMVDVLAFFKTNKTSHSADYQQELNAIKADKLKQVAEKTKKVTVESYKKSAYQQSATAEDEWQDF